MQMSKSDIDRALDGIAELIDDNDSFTLIAHVSPDGDTIGSLCALRLALLSLNKRVQAVCEGRVPKIYRFLPGAESIIAVEDSVPTDVVIAVDCADEDRMGSAYGLFTSAKHTANIDHHVTNPNYAFINAVEHDASAAAQVMKGLIERLNVPFTAEIATCLLCGLVTDTGNFAYSNTTADAMHSAAELLQRGADNALINRAVYRSAPVSKRRMLGVGLIKAEFVHGGRIALCVLKKEDFAPFDAHDEDCEGIIDYLRDVDSVEIAMLMREKEKDVYKVSLRGKEYADVCSVAEKFGGGGHRLAAGCTVSGDADELKREFAQLLEQVL